MPISAEVPGNLEKFDDPIVALASGPGPAAISIIRYTGRNILPLIAAFLEGESLATKPDNRYIRRRKVIDPLTKELVDDVMLVHFAGPKSYTGEDVVEIYCHGGPYLVQRILQISFDQGFRAAFPGEFSQRAYINGKIDLTQAEGIKELTTAVSEQQWKAAIHLAQGELKTYIIGLRQLLIDALALLEARIDFPDEEETKHVLRDDVCNKVKDCYHLIQKLISGYKTGRVALQGFKVAIVGPPNAGKSTLLNYFVGHQRALVTDIPGTTRDYIAEHVLLDGRLFCFFDTAGIRQDAENIEKMGIEFSIKVAQEADLIIAMIPATATVPEKDAQLANLRSLFQGEVLVVASQIDRDHPKWSQAYIQISTPSKVGLEELKKILVEKVDQHLKSLNNDDPYVCNSRQMQALKKAEGILDNFFHLFHQGVYEEMLAFELIQARDALSQIIGEVTNEDILDQIFSQFCLGK